MARNPSPPPKAINGASGPITAPSPIEASAASTTPGSSIGCVGAGLRPSAGMCPPVPGRRTIARAVITPAITSTGSDHHSGVLSNPRVFGRWVYTPCWIW